MKNLAILSTLVALTACEHSALSQLSRANTQMTMNIPLKEQQLQQLNAKNTALAQEKQHLIAELDNKNLSLSELSEELARCENTLAKIQTSNTAQRAEYQSMQKRIHSYKTQVNTLKSSSSSNDAIKLKRIEELKSKIRNELETGED